MHIFLKFIPFLSHFPKYLCCFYVNIHQPDNNSYFNPLWDEELTYCLQNIMEMKFSKTFKDFQKLGRKIHYFRILSRLYGKSLRFFMPASKIYANFMIFQEKYVFYDFL